MTTDEIESRLAELEEQVSDAYDQMHEAEDQRDRAQGLFLDIQERLISLEAEQTSLLEMLAEDPS